MTRSPRHRSQRPASPRTSARWPRVALMALLLALLVTAACMTTVRSTVRSGVQPQAEPGQAPNADPKLQVAACLVCHSDPGRAEQGMPQVSLQRYGRSAHADLDCIDCHEPADARGYDATPHRLASGSPTACVECHDDFQGIHTALQTDVHAGLEHFRCSKCHDPHTLLARTSAQPVREKGRSLSGNKECRGCHVDSVVQFLKARGRDRGHKGLSAAHAWLPETDRHMKSARCATCHAAGGANEHGIRPSSEASRTCSVCHARPEIELNRGKTERVRQWGPVTFTHAHHFRFDGCDIACTHCHHEETGDETWDNKWPQFMTACAECHDSPEDEQRASSGPALDEAQKAYPSPLHHLCISCHEREKHVRAPTACVGCHRSAPKSEEVR